MSTVRSTIGAVARVESRLFISHPALLVGVALSVVWLFGADRQDLPLLQFSVINGLRGLLPALAGSFIAASLLASRSRRAGLEEQLRSQQMSRASLISAQLLATSLAALPGALIVIGYLTILRLFTAAIGSPSIFEAAVWAVIMVLSAWFGVAAEVWLRSTAGMFLGVATIVGVALFIEDPPGSSTFTFQAWRSLGMWVPLDWAPPELSNRRPGLHLLYLIAVGTFVATAALLRFHRSLSIAAVSSLAVAAVTVTTWAQLQTPTRTEASETFRTVADPGSVQICQETTAARYCAYPNYVGLIGHWSRTIEPIVNADPVPSRQRLDVLQRPVQMLQATPYPPWASRYVSRFSELLSRWRDDGAVHPEFRWTRGRRAGTDQFRLGIQAATRVVGFLPPDVPLTPAASPEGTCNTAGEARTVLALWLAASSTPSAEARFHQLHRGYGLANVQREDLSSDDDASLGDYRTGVEPVLIDHAWTIEWPRLEADVAAVLLTRPREEVLRTVRQHWTRLTDPHTPTHEIVNLFDLPEPRLLSLEEVRVGARCN